MEQSTQNADEKEKKEEYIRFKGVSQDEDGEEEQRKPNLPEENDSNIEDEEDISEEDAYQDADERQERCSAGNECEYKLRDQ